MLYRLAPLVSLILICGCTAGSRIAAVDPGRPRVFLLDIERLAAIRAHPGQYSGKMAALRIEADQRLGRGPYTVVAKDSLPPSGDRHDYMSMGPYWWPDPKKPDGLPYIRRDGETNPERQRIPDDANMGRMMGDVRVLALAYYLTGDERYADHAVLLLRTWYLDPATRMNPNLNYGQGIPGITEGRGIGIIETHQIGMVLDAVGLLEGSRAWTAADQQGMVRWMGDYLDWLLESPHGRDEADEHNNHGTWYDVQTAAIALFVGWEDLARSILKNSIPRRVATQIEPDGTQPYELARTKSWSYSVMNLQGFLDLAMLGEHVGIDLWNAETADGRSIRKALDYLKPFAVNRRPWLHRQIVPFDPEALAPLLLRAARPYGPEYAEAARGLSGKLAVWDVFGWQPE